ncbi:hypothetical protein LTR36_001695 [Oleoguttula mirabilis]|uniref:Uncharacterized protein n=1 Tax=Oleoguttula mirabilis TaxID=1507867 RepID=A0AAV9JNN7_9PEZI|nr:hypothetical protein LTR36_001695 [Oleoguttula mirabilis]
MSAPISQSATGADIQPHLLNLPPELRNSIYEYVASGNERARFNEHGLVPHALAQTCHQICNEFESIYQHTTKSSMRTLRVRIVDFDFQPFIAYLTNGFPNARSLQTIKFDIFLTETIVAEKVRGVKEWLEFCEEHSDLRRIEDCDEEDECEWKPVIKTYYVECRAFDEAETVMQSMMAAPDTLSKSRATADDPRERITTERDLSSIMTETEMAEFRLRAKLAQHGGFLRKRKFDQAGETNLTPRKRSWLASYRSSEKAARPTRSG